MIRIALKNDAGEIVDTREILNDAEIEARAVEARDKKDAEWQKRIADQQAQASIDVRGAYDRSLIELKFKPPEGLTMVTVPDGETYEKGGSHDDVAGYTPPPPPPRDIVAEATAHALKLKIDNVNAKRTDGGEPFPVSLEALAEITDHYSRLIMDFSAAQLLDKVLSAEDRATIERVRSGNLYFIAVDQACKIIAADPKAADPIESDPRWPAIPAA